MASDAPEPAKRKATKYPIPVKHLAAIARAADTWNQMEFLVDRAIWKLVHVEQPVVACLTSQFNGVFPRMNALISLIALFKLSEEAEKQFKKLNGDLGSLSNLRNRIIHDPRFVRDGTEIVRFEVDGKKSLSFGSKPETVQFLESFRDDVNTARQRFLDIWAMVAKVIDEQPQLLQKRLDRINLYDLEKPSLSSEAAERQRPPRRRGRKSSGFQNQGSE